MTYAIGDTFTNGFTIIDLPTSPGNNTEEYLIANTFGMQYYVTLDGLNTYDPNGTFGNGNGGSYGASTTGSLTIFEPDLLPGSPYILIAAGTASGVTIPITTISGSMVRLSNLSDYEQPFIVGFDNSSSVATGPVLFGQALDPGQIVDINIRTRYGIVLKTFGAMPEDFGINLSYDTGSASNLTGYPYEPLPLNSASTTTIVTGAGTCIGLRNCSGPQNCVLTGYDNASTTSGPVVFRQSALGDGQGVNIRATFNFGLTVGITNASTNSDWPVNVLYEQPS